MEEGTAASLLERGWQLLSRLHVKKLVLFGRYHRHGEAGLEFPLRFMMAQGLLTNRYLSGIPADARASKPHGFLKKRDIDEGKLTKIRALNELARERGQSLAQMALAWVLRDGRITSALIGASRVEQIEQNVAALSVLAFTDKDLARIDAILGNA
jgi:aryl-alcohol dehydrogenase-like predicted oxidoreductase